MIDIIWHLYKRLILRRAYLWVVASSKPQGSQTHLKWKQESKTLKKLFLNTPNIDENDKQRKYINSTLDLDKKKENSVTPNQWFAGRWRWGREEMAPCIIWLVLVILQYIIITTGHFLFISQIIVLEILVSMIVTKRVQNTSVIVVITTAIFIFSKLVKCMRLRLRSKLPRSFSSPSAVWRDLSLSEIELVKNLSSSLKSLSSKWFFIIITNIAKSVITIITIYRVIIILIIIKFYIHFSEWWWWLSLKAVSFHVCSCCLLSTETLIK